MVDQPKKLLKICSVKEIATRISTSETHSADYDSAGKLWTEESKMAAWMLLISRRKGKKNEKRKKKYQADYFYGFELHHDDISNRNSSAKSGSIQGNVA